MIYYVEKSLSNSLHKVPLCASDLLIDATGLVDIITMTQGKVVKEAMTILGGLEEEALKNYLIKYYAQRKATKKVRKKLEKELKNAKSI